MHLRVESKILLAFGLSAIVIQAAPASQAVLNSPLPTPGKFDSPLPTPALCPHITNQTASNMDAKMYASDLGVDLDTAILLALNLERAAA
ncbi:MAG: hypothetical protein U9Q70_02580 [Chloroflexota bacterium]|nr:hypothetical protein [Chloroflexota bacterium]